jgi:predicted phage gp36 major capsid-like protein
METFTEKCQRESREWDARQARNVAAATARQAAVNAECRRQEQQREQENQRRDQANQRQQDESRRNEQARLEKSRHEAQLKATNRNTLVTGLGAAAVAYSVYDTAPRQRTSTEFYDSTKHETQPACDEALSYFYNLSKEDQDAFIKRAKEIGISTEGLAGLIAVQSIQRTQLPKSAPPLPPAGSSYINGAWVIPKSCSSLLEEFELL